MIHFVVPAAHDKMDEYLGHWGLAVAPRIRVLHAEALPRRRRFPRGVYVLAGLDVLSPGLARFQHELHARLVASGGVAFLNDPRATLRRGALLEELARLGRNDFRAHRATSDLASIRYPAFVRHERSHGGPLSPLLHSRQHVDAAIGRALVQGYPLRELLVVEFCDTACEDGRYRKYAAFGVGDRVIARSLTIGTGWVLKFQGGELSRAAVLEERDYVATNPHAAELAKIFALARVGYGRIDYSVRDGRIQTWEINLNPTIGRGLRPSRSKVSPELQPIRQETKELFYGRFQEAWEAVDVEAAAEDIEVEIDPRVVRDALAVERDGERFLALRRVLRPAKPLLEPVAARVLPLVARAARAARRG